MDAIRLRTHRCQENLHKSVWTPFITHFSWGFWFVFHGFSTLVPQETFNITATSESGFIAKQVYTNKEYAVVFLYKYKFKKQVL